MKRYRICCMENEIRKNTRFQITGSKILVNAQEYPIESIQNVHVEAYRRTGWQSSWRSWAKWLALQLTLAAAIVLGHALEQFGYSSYAKALYLIAIAAFVALLGDWINTVRTRWKFGIVFELGTRSILVYSSSNEEEVRELAREIERIISLPASGSLSSSDDSP